MEKASNVSSSTSSFKGVIYFLVALVIILAIALVGIGGYLFGQNSSKTKQASNQSIQISPLPTQEPIDSSPTPTIDEESNLKNAIKTALVTEHGSQANSLNVTVSKINGNFASGGAVDDEGIGGAMWFAAKVNNDWKLVWDGNGTISCNNLTSYSDYPSSMIPECWDESNQKLIKR